VEISTTNPETRRRDGNLFQWSHLGFGGQMVESGIVDHGAEDRGMWSGVLFRDSDFPGRPPARRGNLQIVKKPQDPEERDPLTASAQPGWVCPRRWSRSGTAARPLSPFQESRPCFSGWRRSSGFHGECTHACNGAGSIGGSGEFVKCTTPSGQVGEDLQSGTKPGNQLMSEARR
jgi:hypothetical protein